MHVLMTIFKPVVITKEPKTKFHKLLAKLKKDERLTVSQAVARIGGIRATVARLLRRIKGLGYARSVPNRGKLTVTYEATAKLYKAKDVLTIHRK